MKPLSGGLERRYGYALGTGDTAAAIGNPGVEVASTPALIKFVESACYELILPFYEAGDATVGVHVSVDHRAPARVNRAIEVAVRLVEAGQRKLEFEVRITQGDTLVMTGRHVRVVVPRANFAGETSASPAASAAVEFWFDFHSPWCYLAANRIGDIARRQGVRLRWRPIHLANLIDAIDGRRPLEANAAFVRWYQQDLRDQADALGLPLEQHREYPKRPSRALRIALLAEERGCAEAFVREAMRAYWARQGDISDLDTLAQLAIVTGLDATEAEAATADPERKRQLADNQDEAIARGVFGLPAMFFEGKLFWGNDRLDFMESRMAAAPG